MLIKNKFTTYVLYAIGEIILVVVGILIAVQIDDWNKQKQNHKTEMRYISDLINDLTQDSIYLASIKKISDAQVKSKDRLEEFWEGKKINEDSLYQIFQSQWANRYSFKPSATTLSEMKSTGTLGVISNELLRKKILETYFKYDQYLENDEALYKKLQEKCMDAIYERIPNLFGKFTFGDMRPDLNVYLQLAEIKNRLLGNHVWGLNLALVEIIEVNSSCLSSVKEEYRKLSTR